MVYLRLEGSLVQSWSWNRE